MALEVALEGVGASRCGDGQLPALARGAGGCGLVQVGDQRFGGVAVVGGYVAELTGLALEGLGCFANELADSPSAKAGQVGDGAREVGSAKEAEAGFRERHR